MMDHATAELSPVDAIPSSEAHELDWPDESSPHPETHTELPFAFALDLLRMGIILTDAHAQILHANRDARGLLSEQRFLRLGMGRLSAVHPKCAGPLLQAIRACTERDAGSGAPLGIAVPLIDADECSIAAWVLPARPNADRPHQRVAAIFIRSSIDVLSEDMFSSTFGATAAEIRVLKLLLTGMTIDEVKVALNLSRNTVTTHVKALFAKTGATRQAELLRLAASCIAPASAVDLPAKARLEPSRRREAAPGWTRRPPAARRRAG